MRIQVKLEGIIFFSGHIGILNKIRIILLVKKERKSFI